MGKVRDIYQSIDLVAPFHTCESFDNVGLLIGDINADVENCLITMDITHAAIDEAVEKGCSLILTHHPVIFHPLKKITADSIHGRLLRHGLTVISAHTNMDKAPEIGVNISLAKRIGVENFASLPDDECAAIASLSQPMTGEALANHLASVLSLQGLRFYDAGKPIKKLMICCGGGGSCIHEAIACGVDALVGGDFKHDHVVDAANAGVSCFDCGHFETERQFVPVMAGFLSEKHPEIRFIEAESCKPHFVYRVYN